MEKSFRIIVLGAMNTDITGLGVERIIGSGELTLGGEIMIGPGGKARNMAQMCAALLEEGAVTMIGRTVRDPFGLWKIPYDSLTRSGVNTEAVIIEDFDPDHPRYPGIALIPVDLQGNNQIYVLPGINSSFSPDDVFSFRHLFEDKAKPIVLLALEMPIETVMMVLKLSEKNGLKVLLDPGGIDKKQAQKICSILDKVFLIKPNEHEMEILSGIKVKDFRSASEASDRLLQYGVNYVFITQGKEGGYLFGRGVSVHLPAPKLPASDEKDATGCGDQVLAALAAAVISDYKIKKAAELAIKAGTMQFNRAGIKPITHKELFNNHG